MARAHLNKAIIRKTSGLPSDGSCQVYEPGTTTPLAQTIYVGDTGVTARANPFTFTAGVIDFFLDVPQRVKLAITPSGGAEQIFDNIDVAPPAAPIPVLDPSETADIQPVGTAAADGGTGTEVALANHVHASPLLTELRLQRIMEVGAPCPSIRTTASISLATTDTTVLTVAAGRKYVVKSITLSNSTAASATCRVFAGSVWIGRQFTLAPGQSITVDLALVLDAGQAVVALGSTTGFYATVAYADLPDTEVVARYGYIDTLAANTWTTLFTAAANTVLTCFTICNYSLSNDPTSLGVRLANSGNSILHAEMNTGGMLVIDTPLYVPSGAAVQVYDSDGNKLGFSASGYPAAS